MQMENGCAKSGVLVLALIFALNSIRAVLTALHLWAKVGRECKSPLLRSLSISGPQTYV